METSKSSPVKTASVVSTGCHRRGLDAAKVEKYLQANGYLLSESENEADINVILTCGYCKAEEDQSMFMVNRLKRLKGRLVVLGCLPGISETRLKHEFKGEYLSTKELHKLDEIFPDFVVKFKDIPEVEVPMNRFRVVLRKDFKSRILQQLDARGLKPYYPYTYFEPWEESKGILRVSNGCTSKCSYCAIHLATGKLVSKPLEQVIDECKRLMCSGYKIIKISGEDTGAYGIDIKSSFSELLEKIDETLGDSDIRLELAELNPVWVVRHKDAIIKLLRKGKIERISCPIQSGSHKILKAMRRASNIDQVIQVLNEFKEACSVFYLVTHIIVGFPGETEEDLEQSINFVKQTKLDEAGIFTYSDREGSEAVTFKNKLSNAVINQRKLYIEKSIKEFNSQIRVNFNA